MEDKKKIQVPRIVLIIGIIVMVLLVVGIIFLIVVQPNQENEPVLENEQNQNEVVENIVENTITEEIADEPLPQIEINSIAEVNSTIDGNVPCYYNPVIPAGFKAINKEQDTTIDEMAKWGERNAYLSGLVIEDEKGNQFVWIPVENMQLFHTTDWQRNEPTEQINTTYLEPMEEERQAYEKKKKKVQKYGGFYVGRFETGDGDITEARTTTRNSDNMVIQKYAQVYNYVPFMSTTIDRREVTGARELALKFGNQNQYQTVTTSVLYGVQWDAILRFLVSEESPVNDSTSWGNYPNATLSYLDSLGNTYQKVQGEARLLQAGSSEQTKAKNIYDIAGNLYEWTMESAGSSVRVVRGGAYLVNIGQLAASRYAYAQNTANNSIGFRISFYID